MSQGVFFFWGSVGPPGCFNDCFFFSILISILENLKILIIHCFLCFVENVEFLNKVIDLILFSLHRVMRQPESDQIYSSSPKRRPSYAIMEWEGDKNQCCPRCGNFIPRLSLTGGSHVWPFILSSVFSSFIQSFGCPVDWSFLHCGILLFSDSLICSFSRWNVWPFSRLLRSPFIFLRLLWLPNVCVLCVYVHMFCCEIFYP